MSLIPDEVQEQRDERPVFGSLFLMISGFMTVFAAFTTAMQLQLSFFPEPLLADIIVGLALVGAGFVVYVRPALTLKVGVGTALYIVVAIIFPAIFTAPTAMWVSVLGVLLCVAWATTHTGPILTEKKPTT